MSRIIQKSIYGNVAILKSYCKICKQNSFVIDGELQCCNALVDKIPKTEKLKRETESEKHRSTISKKLKDRILFAQNGRCIYCNQKLNELWWNKRKSKYINLRIHYDHFICWNYSGDNHENNLYASCHICNGIKSDKYFYDLISAREFINERRKEKGY